MSAKSEIIIKNITQAAQILGLATNINIIPKTATKMVYNSNKTRDNLLIIGFLILNSSAIGSKKLPKTNISVSFRPAYEYIYGGQNIINAP